MKNTLTPDLDRMLLATGPLWDRYRDARVLVTGGTGFFGGWLLESLLHASDQCGLRARVTVLTRDPGAFLRQRPHLAGHLAVTLLQGDVLTLVPPPATFTHVLHAATSVDARLNRENPLLVLDTIVEGTRRVLEVARSCGARRFLLTSSGAVYGRQPPDLAQIPEEHPGVPGSVYGEGKLKAELLSISAGREHGFDAVVARCFAFAGPYLPLTAHYAIGNFVGDALAGRPIRVEGDGTPLRSYLYGADLAAWLWTLLARGVSGRAYNVGSEKVVSIADLATTVARVLGTSRGVQIATAPTPGKAPERYVPSTERARVELGVAETFDLETSIRRMATFAERRRAE